MCDFCSRFDFGTASYETDKYGSRVIMAGGSYRFPLEKQFLYCPICGLSRVEIAKQQIRNRQE
jgi:hypothetical protein